MSERKGQLDPVIIQHQTRHNLKGDPGVRFYGFLMLHTRRYLRPLLSLRRKPLDLLAPIFTKVSLHTMFIQFDDVGSTTIGHVSFERTDVVERDGCKISVYVGPKYPLFLSTKTIAFALKMCHLFTLCCVLCSHFTAAHVLGTLSMVDDTTTSMLVEKLLCLFRFDLKIESRRVVACKGNRCFEQPNTFDVALYLFSMLVCQSSYLDGLLSQEIIWNGII